jgi:DNA-binding response OmpR family regulator
MRMAPRLILLDVRMQGIDGYETCRLLRNNPNLAHIPIAFLTARNTGEDVRRGMTIGGNDFIIKPFDAAKLRERINFWVNRRIAVRATRR